MLKTFWDIGANWTNLPEGIWQEQRQQSPISAFRAFQYVGSKYVREPLRAMLAAVTTPHQRRHAHYTPQRAAAHSPPPPPPPAPPPAPAPAPPAPPAPPPLLITPHTTARRNTHTRPHDAYISNTRSRVFIYQFSVVKMQHFCQGPRGTEGTTRQANFSNKNLTRTMKVMKPMRTCRHPLWYCTPNKGPTLGRCAFSLQKEPVK